MEKKEAAKEIMAIVKGELATARDALQGQSSWRTIDAAMTQLRRIASILDHDREPPKAAN
jgi:hypothetical protein